MVGNKTTCTKYDSDGNEPHPVIIFIFSRLKSFVLFFSSKGFRCSYNRDIIIWVHQLTCLSEHGGGWTLVYKQNTASNQPKLSLDVVNTQNGNIDYTIGEF